MAKWFELRPTFEIPVEASRDHAITKLAQLCQNINQPSLFFVHGEYGELHLPKAEHRLWSPHLSFYVANDSSDIETGTHIKGRFAPRLDMWTLIWVLYLAMAFTSFFSFALAYSQWAIGESTWWHWVGIVALLAILGIYVVAQIGQQLSADQMRWLRQRLEEILCQGSLVSAERQG